MDVSSFFVQVLLLGRSATKRSKDMTAFLEEAERELDAALHILDDSDRRRYMRSNERRPLLDRYQEVQDEVNDLRASAPQWNKAKIRASAAAFWNARSNAKEALEISKKLNREVKSKSKEALRAFLARSSTTTLVTSQGP